MAKLDNKDQLRIYGHMVIGTSISLLNVDDAMDVSRSILQKRL